jgi:hypothetical protein
MSNAFTNTSTIRRRTEAITGQLLGVRAKVYTPHRRGKYAEVGEVTGIGYPLVRVTCGGDDHYRHVEDIDVKGRMNEA